MIKLKIKNWFQKDADYKEDYDVPGIVGGCRVTNDSSPEQVKPYDMDKWKDGRIYEFETLKDVKEFIDSCDIEFTDEVEEGFCDWSWMGMVFGNYIDPSEDNLMIFEISCHPEWRD